MSCIRHHEDIERPSGYDRMEAICMGLEGDKREWEKAWLEGVQHGGRCADIMRNRVYVDGDDRRFSPEGFRTANDYMDYSFKRYISPTDELGGHNLVEPGQIGYNPVQDALLDACTYTQGICTKAAINLCNCTREEIVSNTALLRLCGCQAPALDPELYPNIPRECDPLCSQERVSKLRDENGIVKECKGTVCVINNMSIQAAKSMAGSFHIEQICPQCDSGICRCIIDMSIPEAIENSGLSNRVTFQQTCGNGAVCIGLSRDGTMTSRECSSIGGSRITLRLSPWFYIGIALFLLIGILALLASRK